MNNNIEKTMNPEAPFMQEFLSRLGNLNSRLCGLQQRNYELSRRSGFYEDRPCCEEACGTTVKEDSVKVALLDVFNQMRNYIEELEQRASELERFF